MLITGRLPKACSRKQIFRRFYAILHLTVNFDHKYKHNLYHRYFDTKLGQGTLFGDESIFKVQGVIGFSEGVAIRYRVSFIYNYLSLTSSYSNFAFFMSFKIVSRIFRFDFGHYLTLLLIQELLWIFKIFDFYRMFMNHYLTSIVEICFLGYFDLSGT